MSENGHNDAVSCTKAAGVPGKPFAKGFDPRRNVSGANRISKPATEAIQAVISQDDWNEIMAAQMKLAKQGSTKAAQFLSEVIQGKPTQSHTGESEGAMMWVSSKMPNYSNGNGGN